MSPKSGPGLPSPAVRRVVTAVLPSGRSGVASDELVRGTPGTPGIVDGGLIYQLWGADSRPYLETGGAHPAFDASVYPPEGFRFLVMDLAPATSRHAGPAVAAVRHGVHTTPSVDLILVIRGEIWLDLDEQTVRLAAGDTVVQNGTSHAWHNYGQVPATVGVVMLGSARSATTRGRTAGK